MDWNRIEGNWKQFKGRAKEKWGRLTDDDLDVINGRREQLEGKIQERYGLAKDQTKQDVDAWFNSLTNITLESLTRPVGCPRGLVSRFLKITWLRNPALTLERGFRLPNEPEPLPRCNVRPTNQDGGSKRRDRAYQESRGADQRKPAQLIVP
jgi:uncharacterized protein YjbJ (UPF0337 family)